MMTLTLLGVMALPARGEVVSGGPQVGKWKTWVLAASTEIQAPTPPASPASTLASTTPATHIWVWWVDDNQQLVDRQRHLIEDNVRSGLEVSAISCWEVAKPVQYGRLELACPLENWMEQALAYPGVQLLELTPRIAIESTKLPGSFHRPAFW